jgi:uncharacterized protein
MQATKPIESDVYSSQHTFWRSLALHLLPGVLILLFYVLVGPVVVNMGYPSIVALPLAILLVLTPFELGYLFFLGRRLNGRLSLQGIVLYQEPTPAWQYVAVIVPLLLWVCVIMGLWAPAVDRWFIDRFFSWLPGWFFINGFAGTVAAYSRSARVTTFVLMLVLNGVLGPIVEELYFRGFLLPRLRRYGWWAPVLNTVLFSLYHLFTPWENVPRILAFVPMAAVVHWKRNIRLSMLTHVLMNVISVLSMARFLV